MKSFRILFCSVSKPKLNFIYSRRLSTVARTIFALSSGRGKCGVAVVRVSGPQCSSALSALAGNSCLMKPRLAQLRTLRDPHSNEILDRAIVIWFPAPKSFTGEDTCEFQVHGGLAVITGLLEALGKVPGLYPADPGEFSKRAFFNGSMDLTEAEGLADLIHAETEMQRKQAIHQMNGSLHKLYGNWRTVLLQILAHVEAYIDFSEDDNIDDGVIDSVWDSATKLSREIQTHLKDGRRGQRLRDGVRATIVGVPNVGKSSLLNLLCERPAAIVTPIAGTTRDVVEQYINISGYPLSLADTAGIRCNSAVIDDVEKEGIARAKQFAHSSDIILLVIDSQQFLMECDWISKQNTKIFVDYVKSYSVQLGIEKTIRCEHRVNTNENTQAIGENMDTQCLIVLSKIDLIRDEKIKEAFRNLEEKFKNVVLLSCVTQDGLPQLMHFLKAALEVLCGNPSLESPALSQVRHRQHLVDCHEHLHQYLYKTQQFSHSQTNKLTDSKLEVDLAMCAEELRRAVHHMGRITGHVTTEQILDVIFRDFCIGK